MNQTRHNFVRFQIHDSFKVTVRKQISYRNAAQQQARTLINQMTNASMEVGVLIFYPLPYFDRLSHQIKHDEFPHLRRGDLDVDDDGGKGGLPQL